VGAHLANAAAAEVCELYYWRDGAREVDFVVRRGDAVIGLEVKSGRAGAVASALGAFRREFDGARTLVVGGDGMAIEDFLLTPVEELLGR
jgi:hypothetical protein